MVVTEEDKKKVLSADVQTEMLKALLVVPPKHLRLLAKWFEQSDFLKEDEGTDVQDNLRKMANLSEGVLTKIQEVYETV